VTNKFKHETYECKTAGLYLGLLTYTDSQYSRAPFIKLFEKVLKFGKSIQFDVKASIAEENPFSTSDVKLADLLLAKIYTPILHRRWGNYLAGKKSSKVSKNNLRIFINFFQYCLRLTNSNFRAKEQKRLSRDLNITSGHIKLLEDFLNSDTPVGLILEDDAGFNPSRELVSTLFDLVSFAQSVSSPSYFIDVSDSFTFQELSAQHLVMLPKPKDKHDKFLGSSICATLKPFTNTCCAILYNRNMAILILARVKNYSKIPGKRVFPIDWMFNSILLELENSNVRVESFHLDPGIFAQNSLAYLKEK